MKPTKLTAPFVMNGIKLTSAVIFGLVFAVTITGCTWIEGDYLAQIVVNDSGRHGQAPTKLSLRCPGQCAR